MLYLGLAVYRSPAEGEGKYERTTILYAVIPLIHQKTMLYREFIAIRLKIQTKSSHKIHKSELLRLDFVNLNSWIAINIFGGHLSSL